MTSLPEQHHNTYSLVLDAGTTNVKAFVFDRDESIVAQAELPIMKSFPKRGWVEQDPYEMVAISQQVLRAVVHHSKLEPEQFRGFGLANQRETVVAWNKATGKAIYPAIVWQDTRTAKWCRSLQAQYENYIRETTGLSLIPYFSASKAAWLLKNLPEAAMLADYHQLAIGTVDTWLLYNLVQGNPFLTDYTNASRTLLFNIRTRQWDPGLFRIFGVPEHSVPAVQASQSLFGHLKPDIIGAAVPVVAVCGDQQASLYAAGTTSGTTKITYGTGTFVMQVLGSSKMHYKPFFTTVAVGQAPQYVLEARVWHKPVDAAAILRSSVRKKRYLITLAKKANMVIQRLPAKPQELIIDGGWMRDGQLRQIQADISHIPVREQSIYNGTALGIARLVFTS